MLLENSTKQSVTMALENKQAVTCNLMLSQRSYQARSDNEDELQKAAYIK